MNKNTNNTKTIDDIVIALSIKNFFILYLLNTFILLYIESI